MLVAGKSGNEVPPGLSRLVHVAVEGPVRVTSKTWPGVAEVKEL
jgi:hypothetical protein